MLYSFLTCERGYRMFLFANNKVILIWSLGFTFIALIQLTLNMMSTSGAYLMSELKTEYRDLKIEEQIINEELASLQNPYRLSILAEELGMIYSDESAKFIILD
jgi:hypothetical protein